MDLIFVEDGNQDQVGIWMIQVDQWNGGEEWMSGQVQIESEKSSNYYVSLPWQSLSYSAQDS